MNGIQRITTGWSWEWIEQWSQLLGGCNWYTFHPVMIELEDDRCMGGVEAMVVFLGLGFRVRWTYDSTRVNKIQAEADRMFREFDDDN